ncbi:DUF6126 family protein [Streptomyces rubellomurinus]|uniref:Small hydrophobic protein n=2 Tax=Streptomyces TaxID=1883 RepID=A0A0F2T5W9_STRR3|nr:DUF6126 family protein [Streptomyces rubellomurinus]KJS53745.1 hypothetical protein VM98_23445 [Streptomyces rubellomurinus subsp. indigoferus]KJS58588.1 hypothetical protein VM95_32455 [Streptomyces rubellomurinus]
MSDSTTGSASESSGASRGDGASRPGGAADSTNEEKARRKQMLIRAGIYIFATHLFAGFVLLLFALGDRK